MKERSEKQADKLGGEERLHMTQGSRGSTVVTEVTEGVSPLRRELWLLVLSTKELPGDQAPLSSEEEAGK